MDEVPNVNNLNGVPNFGHGLPSDISEEEVIAGDPEAVSEETKDSEVELLAKKKEIVMALASPSASSRSILAVTDVATTGTVLYPFTVPQDAQSITAKVFLNSTWNASGSALVYFQTSEDGGTTWRDMAVVSVGAATVAATMNNQNAQFLNLALAAMTDRGAANYIGSVAASTLSAGTPAASAVGITSGLPVLGTANRVQITYANTITTGGINVVIYAPTTDFTA